MTSLLGLKKFIAERKVVSIALLVQQFGSTRSEILALLELLIRKGCVERCTQKPACGTKCFKCQSELVTLYQWVESAIVQ
jgi:putative ferrous iron transport protein C